MRWQPVTGAALALACLWGMPVLGCGSEASRAFFLNGEEAESDRPFEVIESGSYSDIKDERRVVLRDAAAWEAFYAAHRPEKRAPAINFEDEMVVAVVLQRPTGGYAVDIERVQRQGDDLVVDYSETRPGPDAITIQVLTQPFVFATVERTPGAVRFQTPSPAP